MNFISTDQLLCWIRIHRKNLLGCGSQGECYLVGNRVYKYFWQFIDEEYFDNTVFNKKDILQFSNIKNDTYIWPTDVITVDGDVVGYITDYVDAKSLFQMSPINVNLDTFVSDIERADKDIREISNNGVYTYDVAYNILYGNDGFKVIDTMEYVNSDKGFDELYRHNLKTFLYECRMFLIDGYFDKFLADDKNLYDMCNDDINFVDFVSEFRKKLSEREGFEIKTLGEAKKSMKLTKKGYYIRSLY